MMRLPDALEQALWTEIQTIEGERKMAYVTSVERLAIQRGLQEGEAKGRVEGEAKGRVEGQADLLARQLTKRFGTLSAEIQARLAQATSDQLERWGERLLDADSLDGVFDDH
jgi:flagellar biosynthesis/type III secretory pathway protein FliH